MSSFIILEKKGDKKVLFKGNFDKYRQYSDITKTLFEKIKKLKVNLQPSDKFKLTFDDIEKLLYQKKFPKVYMMKNLIVFFK